MTARDNRQRRIVGNPLLGQIDAKRPSINYTLPGLKSVAALAFWPPGLPMRGASTHRQRGALSSSGHAADAPVLANPWGASLHGPSAVWFDLDDAPALPLTSRFVFGPDKLLRADHTWSNACKPSRLPPAPQSSNKMRLREHSPSCAIALAGSKVSRRRGNEHHQAHFFFDFGRSRLGFLAGALWVDLRLRMSVGGASLALARLGRSIVNSGSVLPMDWM